jgi:hypothetical protein
VREYLLLAKTRFAITGNNFALYQVHLSFIAAR